uniref:Nose resistant to fluoxetine protein 6 n=1 Tax=Elaeophora elaphi TaxID=1147741 RepID=A0A0R3RP30_9BILA
LNLFISVIKFKGHTPVCTVKQASVRFRPIDYKTWIVLHGDQVIRELSSKHFVTLSAKLSLVVIAFIGAMALLATTLDLFTIYFNSDYHKLASIEGEQLFRCLMTFSVIRNTKDIFNIEPSSKPDQIRPIHFFRFISMVWVIFGHSTIVYMMFSCKHNLIIRFEMCTTNTLK